MTYMCMYGQIAECQLAKYFYRLEWFGSVLFITTVYTYKENHTFTHPCNFCTTDESRQTNLNYLVLSF